MADRATVSQVVQIGKETTPGVLVPATQKLLGVSIEPNIASEFVEFRPMGSKYLTLTPQGKEWATAAVNGPATYSELPYLLSSILTQDTPTADAVNGAYTWLFQPESSEADDPITFSVEIGNSVRAHNFSYGLLNELSWTFNRGEVTVDGSMIGQRVTDGVTLTDLSATAVNEVQTLTMSAADSAGGTFTLSFRGATTSAIPHDAIGATVQTALRLLSTVGAGNVTVSGPASGPYVVTFIGALAGNNVPLIVANAALVTGPSTPYTIAVVQTAAGVPITPGLIPVLGREINVYADDSPDGFGTTKLLRAFSAVWTLNNRFGPVWVLNEALPSFAAHVELAPTLSMELTLEADAQGMAFLDKARSNQVTYLRIEALGPVIGGAVRNRVRLDMAGRISGMGDFGDQEGVYGIPFTFSGVTDPAWGRAYQIEVVSTLPALT